MKINSEFVTRKQKVTVNIYFKTTKECTRLMEIIYLLKKIYRRKKNQLNIELK